LSQSVQFAEHCMALGVGTMAKNRRIQNLLIDQLINLCPNESEGI
jgi:hypothetical protein